MPELFLYAIIFGLTLACAAIAFILPVSLVLRWLDRPKGPKE